MKVAQSCLTLCNPMDYTIHGILQARTLEWVAFPSRGNSSSYHILTLLPSQMFNFCRALNVWILLKMWSCHFRDLLHETQRGIKEFT